MAIARYLAWLPGLLVAASVCAADLSPDRWPAAIRADVERKEAFSYPPYARTVEGDRGLVTGTLSPIAIHSGAEALRQGGTAADAAATAALTEIASSAGEPVTYAGVLQLLYYDAKTRKVYALDAQWGRYEHETDPATIPDSARMPGAVAQQDLPADQLGRDTLVPGFMAGIEAMHARFGRLAFADLFQPAIWYADHGFVVSPIMAGEFQREQSVLWRTADGRRFASMPDGRLPKTGDLFVQPDTARTLRAVATQGAAYMYTGDWARAYVTAVQGAGGKVTLDDLAHYHALWRAPYSLPFEGATVYGIGENTMGACPTLEALNLLSASKVGEMGPYWRDPKAFEAYVRAIRFAFYSHYLPQNAAPPPESSLCDATLTAQYANAASPKLEPAATAPNPNAEPGHHSDAVVAVDRWGDVAVLVHSSNTVGWGVTGLVVGGVPIPDAAGRNRAWFATAKAGDRLPSGMGPVIALKNGKPVVAVAAIGLSLVPETVRLVGGLLANGQDLRILMSAPELLLTYDPILSSWNWPEPVPAGAYDADMLRAIRAEGLPVKEVTPRNDGRGLAAVVVIDQPSGHARTVETGSLRLFAESDARRLTPPPPLAAPETLNQYIGDFNIDGKLARVTRDGSYLTAKATGTPFLLPLSEDADREFICGLADMRVTFDAPVNRSSNGLVVHLGGVASRGVRIDADEAARIEAADKQH
jgi:gamma-glutamyltranspeptidase / glutathione hydrolase